MYLIEIFLSVQNLVNILSPKVGFDLIFFGRISLFSLDFQANKGQLEFFLKLREIIYVEPLNRYFVGNGNVDPCLPQSGKCSIRPSEKIFRTLTVKNNNPDNKYNLLLRP